MEAQRERIDQVLGGLSREELDRSPAGRTGETLEVWIVHGWHDEAMHQGEVRLLLKSWRAANPG